MSLITPKLFSRVAAAVTCNGVSDCVSLLRPVSISRVWKRKHGGAREAPAESTGITRLLSIASPSAISVSLARLSRAAS